MATPTKTLNKYKQTEIGEIPEGWESTTLGKLAEITSSKRIFASEYLPDGVPFFRSKEIIEKNNGNSVSTELFISEQKYQDIKDKFGAPKENDILLTSVGTLGVPYRVAGGDKFYFKDGNITWFRDLDDTTSEFLFHWLNSDFGKRRLIEKSIGSTQQALTIIALKSVEIALPPIDERKQITSILSSLDDKIELNKKMNKALEEIGNTLFKRWFVDFEFPNKEGKPYKSSGGEMADSELGEVPKGWAVKNLGEALELAYGKALREGERQEGQYPIYGSSGVVGYHNEFLVKAPGIVVGRKGNVGSIFWVDYDFYPIDTTYYVRTDQSMYYAYFALKLSNLVNSDSAVPGLSRGQAYMNTWVCPDRKILTMYDEIAKPIFDQKKKSEEEIFTLLQIRNSLLPRLMSGKLRV